MSSKSSETSPLNYRPPERIERLELPERSSDLGASLAASEREFEIFAAGEDLINLTYADTARFPPPDAALDSFVRAVESAEPYTPYRGDIGVRSTVAENVSAFLGVSVDPEREMLLTAGTQAGLFQTLATVVEYGDTVLLADPDYLCTERMLRFFGASVRLFAIDNQRDGCFLDLGAVESGLKDGARLVVLSHPNNPTGAVFDRETVQGLVSLVANYEAFIVVDELYSRLVYDNLPFYHLRAFPEVRDRCITLLGPSKTESMTGYRVGVVVAPPVIADSMELLEGVMTIRAPAYAQHALGGWLRTDHELVRERTAEYATLRDSAVERLASLDAVDLHPARGSSYLFPRLAVGLPDIEVAQALVRDAQVIVNPGFQFGRRGVGGFRMCFAQDPSVWPGVLERMASTLERLSVGIPSSSG